MEAVVYLDGGYQMTTYELTGGRLISQAEYEAVEETAEIVPSPEESAE
jgi:hypothetical protein